MTYSDEFGCPYCMEHCEDQFEKICDGKIMNLSGEDVFTIQQFAGIKKKKEIESYKLKLDFEDAERKYKIEKFKETGLPEMMKLAIEHNVKLD